MKRALLRAFHALMHLPGALLCVLVPLAAVLLLLSFTRWQDARVLCGAVWALCAYVLAVLCVRAPSLVRYFRQKNRYVRRFREDARWRYRRGLQLSLLCNFAYACMQLGLAIFHGSLWFWAFALYYFLLVAMRLLLLREERRYPDGAQAEKQLFAYRFCAYCLAFMTLSLGVIVGYITLQGRELPHHPITTIAMAAYTFFCVGVAIVGMLRNRRARTPLRAAAKAVSLTAALVSLLVLEVAMISTFGDPRAWLFRRVITTLSGAMLLLFVFGMALAMLYGARKKRLLTQNEGVNDEHESR